MHNINFPGLRLAYVIQLLLNVLYIVPVLRELRRGQFKDYRL